MIVDHLPQMEARSQALVGEVHDAMNAPGDVAGQPVALFRRRGDTASFGARLGADAPPCGEKVCVGRTTPHQNLQPLYHVSCGGESRVSPDPYALAPGGHPERPWRCTAGADEHARPTWHLLGFFALDACAAIATNAALDTSYCETQLPETGFMNQAPFRPREVVVQASVRCCEWLTTCRPRDVAFVCTRAEVKRCFAAVDPTTLSARERRRCEACAYCGDRDGIRRAGVRPRPPKENLNVRKGAHAAAQDGCMRTKTGALLVCHRPRVECREEALFWTGECPRKSYFERAIAGNDFGKLATTGLRPRLGGD